MNALAAPTGNSPDSSNYLTLSSLNHFLFCERRCAMVLLERIWIDNRFTIEGTGYHKKVHSESPSERSEQAGRIARNLDLISHRLRLVGKTDLVEFNPTPFPVEYKRGKRRRWNNDDAQLCAQALCLEEMLDVSIPAGAVYSLLSRRRRNVEFTPQLRAQVIDAIEQMHSMVASLATPLPILKPRCRGCSLAPLCLPSVGSAPDRVADYLQSLYVPHTDLPESPP